MAISLHNRKEEQEETCTMPGLREPGRVVYQTGLEKQRFSDSFFHWQRKGWGEAPQIALVAACSQ
jgi:hypothetical protein